MNSGCEKDSLFIFPDFEVGYCQHIHIIAARRLSQSFSFVNGAVLGGVCEF